jgi:phage terminase small subunit
MTATPEGVVEGKLSPKQQRFVEEYLVDLNASAAMLRAGYKSKNPNVDASKLLAKPSIVAAVSALRDAESKKLGITRERVLTELARVAFSDVRKLFNEHGGMRPIVSLDDEVAAAISHIKLTSFTPPGEDAQTEYTKEVKLADKVSVLKDLARHMGVIEPEKPADVNITLTVEMPREAYREKLRKLAAKAGA